MQYCRICQSSQIKEYGLFRPYTDYSYPVYICLSCGCRFVRREDCNNVEVNIHETLHQSASSYYYRQDNTARMAQALFAKNDRRGLYNLLSQISANQYIMDTLSKNEMNRPLRLLEIGCSRGYLTSYFILLGYDVVGVDVSETAIADARIKFGQHFYAIHNSDFSQLGTFDIVYHVGTIGVVDDPISFTENALSVLSPGGKLLFNSPNVNAAKKMGTIWVSGARPPDLITLFEESFWYKTFAEAADVRVSYKPYDHGWNTSKNIRRIGGLPYLPEYSRTLLKEKKQDGLRNSARQAASGLVRKALTPLSTLGVLTNYPAEFGMYVELTKRVR